MYRVIALFIFLMLFNSLNADDSYQNWEGKYFAIAYNYNHGKINDKTKIFDGNYYTGDDNALISSKGLKDISENIHGATISLGYNKQNESLVYGVELDLSIANYTYENNSGNIRYNTLPGSTFNVNTKIEHDWITNLQAKVGYAHKSSMYYLVAGPSLAKIDYEFIKSDTAFNIDFKQSNNELKLGWNAGLGIEHKLKNNWAIKIEYLYTNFSNIGKDVKNLSGYTAKYTNEYDYEINTFTIGIVKRF
ncbi:hypothetical protein CRV02_12260 [Arcobacter sp. CECT 8989]|uniref:outer membrane protein n=1 Tax=Arcobacter sp. CECT 8989 TaxID=2044509 RepID=UPI00100A75D0|nr:outer membrane beta-barrel protein [Arcobacter sp. CECT 8989]RXJ98964.1 hypothetical protein CRV02_12260 [Arcobacter sp. CECT 8989]